MIANKVVFPAPFGPMRPVMAPRSAVSEAASTASNPPKRLLTPAISSMGTAQTHASSETDEAIGHECEDRDEQRTVEHQVEPGRVAGHRARELVKGAQRQRTDQRSQDGASAADQRHQQRRYRHFEPIGEAWIEVEEILHIEGTGETAEGAGEKRRQELDPERVNPERPRRI